MPRATKADLEKQVKVLERKLEKAEQEVVAVKVLHSVSPVSAAAPVSKVPGGSAKRLAGDILVAIKRHPASMTLTQQLTQAGVIAKLKAAANA